MEEHGSIGSLVLVVLLALVVPFLVTRFKSVAVPVVVGEILIGIVVGQAGFGWVTPHDGSLEFLADFGFVFLMFLSGMEIDFTLFEKPTGPARDLMDTPIALALATFAASLGIAVGISFVLQQLGLAENMWMLALILSTTSLGVVVPVLKETGVMPTRFGQTVLLAALVADFATMLLITILVAVLSNGLSVEVMLIALLGVAAVLLYRIGVFFNRFDGVRTAISNASSDTTHLKMRASFALMILFVALAETVGAEVILGAFLAGAMVALVQPPGDNELRHHLEALGYGFLVPLFFIHVGVGFDLSALYASTSAMLLVPILLGAAVVTKLVPALLLQRVFSRNEALAAGVVLSARLSLIIAASTVGLRLGAISEATNAAIVLVAILTCTGAPIAFMKMVSTWDVDTMPRAGTPNPDATSASSTDEGGAPDGGVVEGAPAEADENEAPAEEEPVEEQPVEQPAEEKPSEEEPPSSRV